MSIKFTSHDTAWRAFQRLRHHFGDEELFAVSWQPSPRYLDSLRRARHFSNEHLQRAARAFFAPKDAQRPPAKKREKPAVVDGASTVTPSPTTTTTTATTLPQGPNASPSKDKTSKSKPVSSTTKTGSSTNKSVKKKSPRKKTVKVLESADSIQSS